MAAAPKSLKTAPAGTIDKPFVLAFIAGVLTVIFVPRGLAELVLIVMLSSYVGWHYWATHRYQGRETS